MASERVGRSMDVKDFGGIQVSRLQFVPEERLTWQALTEAFMKVKRYQQLSLATLEWYEVTFRLFDRFHKEQKIDCPSPLTCTPSHIQGFINWLSQRDRAITVHTKYRALRSFFRWLEGPVGLTDPCGFKSRPRHHFYFCLVLLGFSAISATRPIDKPLEKPFQKSQLVLSEPRFPPIFAPKLILCQDFSEASVKSKISCLSRKR